jgi:hypothetical protein
MEYLTPTHQEILDAVRQAGVVVLVNEYKICGKDQYDGYAMTWRDPQNTFGKNVLVMCNDTIKKNYTDWVGEINRTLAHESVHVAQMCKEGKGYVEPLGFRNDVEKEAFAIQDQPREVLRIVRKYCL